MKWVDVKDDLPKSNKPVVVLTENDGYFIDRFDPSSGWIKYSSIRAWLVFDLY